MKSSLVRFLNYTNEDSLVCNNWRGVRLAKPEDFRQRT